MSKLLDDISTHTLRRDGIAQDELSRELDALGPRWSIIDDALQLALPGPMCRTGVVAAFAGTLADELDHHPRIVIERHGMTLAIRTYDASSITVTDLVFAARIEQWLRANGWPVPPPAPAAT
jgi:pterin-4a-carbinolamine dehydratase